MFLLNIFRKDDKTNTVPNLCNYNTYKLQNAMKGKGHTNAENERETKTYTISNKQKYSKEN